VILSCVFFFFDVKVRLNPDSARVEPLYEWMYTWIRRTTYTWVRGTYMRDSIEKNDIPRVSVRGMIRLIDDNGVSVSSLFVRVVL
jgi:hypothetical protein